MYAPLTDRVSIEDLRKMREEGMTNKQIAEKVGVYPTTIRKYIGVDGTGFGGGSLGNVSRYSEEDIERWRSMREAGMTARDIAAKCGVSEATIYNRLGPKGGKASKHAAALGRTIQAKKAEPIPEEPSACLIIQNKTIELHGLHGTYLVDIKAKEIAADFIQDDGTTETVKLTGENLEEYIAGNLAKIKKLQDQNAELLAIQRKINSMHIGGEMW